MNIITESATSPAVAVPVGGVTLAAGYAATLPIIVNVIVGVYFVLLISRLVYQFVKEIKADRQKEADVDGEHSNQS